MAKFATTTTKAKNNISSGDWNYSTPFCVKER
jgi:hypothetical protein